MSGEVTRFVYTAFSALNSLSQVIRMFLSPWYRKGTLHMEDLSPAFRGMKEAESVLLAPALSQVTVIQNNQHAKVVCLGIAYSAPPHCVPVS